MAQEIELQTYLNRLILEDKEKKAEELRKTGEDVDVLVRKYFLVRNMRIFGRHFLGHNKNILGKEIKIYDFLGMTWQKMPLMGWPLAFVAFSWNKYVIRKAHHSKFCLLNAYFLKLFETDFELENCFIDF